MNTKEMIAVMQAYEDGKQIESKPKSGGFFHVDGHPMWNWSYYEYRIKPTKKPVDLSVLIDSGIDCEFSSKKQLTEMLFGKLERIDAFGYQRLTRIGTSAYSYCRPRLNHIHAWQGGDCPLPEGFVVKPYYRDPNVDPIAKEAGVLRWRRDHRAKECYDIIAFEVIGLADGYCYPWECDE